MRLRANTRFMLIVMARNGGDEAVAIHVRAGAGPSSREGRAWGSHVRAGVGEGTGYFSRAGLAVDGCLAERCRCGTTVG